MIRDNFTESLRVDQTKEQIENESANHHNQALPIGKPNEDAKAIYAIKQTEKLNHELHELKTAQTKELAEVKKSQEEHVNRITTLETNIHDLNATVNELRKNDQEIMAMLRNMNVPREESIFNSRPKRQKPEKK